MSKGGKRDIDPQNDPKRIKRERGLRVSYLTTREKRGKGWCKKKELKRVLKKEYVKVLQGRYCSGMGGLLGASKGLVNKGDFRNPSRLKEKKWKPNLGRRAKCVHGSGAVNGQPARAQRGKDWESTHFKILRRKVKRRIVGAALHQEKGEAFYKGKKKKREKKDNQVPWAIAGGGL